MPLPKPQEREAPLDLCEFGLHVSVPGRGNTLTFCSVCRNRVVAIRDQDLQRRKGRISEEIFELLWDKTRKTIPLIEVKHNLGLDETQYDLLCTKYSRRGASKDKLEVSRTQLVEIIRDFLNPSRQ